MKKKEKCTYKYCFQSLSPTLVSMMSLIISHISPNLILSPPDGPSFRIPAPTQRYVLLNDSLSLVCGTGLENNPQANVTWMAPDGTIIMNGARYNLESGPQIVRLNLTQTTFKDSGTWKCELIVESEYYGVSNGRLSPFDSSVIGEPLEVDIQLTIIGRFYAYNVCVR